MTRSITSSCCSSVMSLPEGRQRPLVDASAVVGRARIERLHVHTHGLIKTQLFCSYPHASEMTARLSARADLRMIWGGDEKIAAVSKSAVRPDGISLGFSDRKSFSVISARSYAAMDEAARDAAAGRLYNDIFWFDQLGCGSPRAIFWLGFPGNDGADLYRRLDAIALQKAKLELRLLSSAM